MRGLSAAIVGVGRTKGRLITEVEHTEVEHKGSSWLEQIPEWGWEVLASPGGGPLRCEGGILQAADQPIGRIDQGDLIAALRRRMAQQAVEGETRGEAQGLLGALDHRILIGSSPHGLFGSRHHVSGR